MTTSADNMVTGGHRCLACGYALIGLASNGNCPECGHAIALSLVERPLSHLLDADAALLLRGVRRVLGSFAATVVGGLLVAPGAVFGTVGVLLILAGLVIMLVGATYWLMGWCGIGAARGAELGQFGVARLFTQVCAWGQVVGLVALPVGFLLPAPLLGVIAWIAPLCFLGTTVAGAEFIRSILGPHPDAELLASLQGVRVCQIGAIALTLGAVVAWLAGATDAGNVFAFFGVLAWLASMMALWISLALLRSKAEGRVGAG